MVVGDDVVNDGHLPMNQPNINEVDFTHLKGSIGGGMAVQRAVAEKWKKITGGPLVEGYGLSEKVGYTTLCRMFC